MKDYKRGSHTVWDCKYHLVWTTKYRYQVLGGDIGNRCRELLREIAISQEMHIYAGSINRDHVHMLIGIPPHLSVSRAVQYLKGRVRTSYYRSTKSCESAIGVSTYGPVVTGLLRVGMLPMRFGKTTLRIRSHRSPMMTLPSYDGYRPKGRLIGF